MSQQQRPVTSGGAATNRTQQTQQPQQQLTPQQQQQLQQQKLQQQQRLAAQQKQQPQQPQQQQQQQQQQQKPAATAQASSAKRMPDVSTLTTACKLSVAEDKPIMLTYWSESFDKSVCIMCNKGSGEKVIYKDSESYTSPIVKSYKNAEDYILMTENSIYIVVAHIIVKTQ
jgi:hypothetical protein